LLLAASNVFLIRQNLQLRSSIENSGPPSLKAGDRVAPFEVKDVDGTTTKLNYPGGGPKHIGLFFSPTCPYSIEQVPYWKKLIAGADRAPIRYHRFGQRIGGPPKNPELC
jgi:hypothetical protein